MKILLLGDLIRMGYAPFAREALAGRADVLYPEENGRFVQYSLRHAQDWKAGLGLSGGDVDVVHWNNGLWDVARLGNGRAGGEVEGAAPALAGTVDGGAAEAARYEYEDENVTPPDFYEYMIGRMHKRLRHLFPRARMVFATTTPAIEERSPAAVTRKNADIRAYNEIARRVLEPDGVRINDLYAFAVECLADRYSDWVHFDPEGCRLLGQRVADFMDI